MKYLLKNGMVFVNNEFLQKDILIHGDTISKISDNILAAEDIVSFDFQNCYIFPGFIDVHVHLREPGFLSKETIKTGTKAAAHGGYTDVCSMPNLNPTPDSMEHLKMQLEAIEKDACIHVYPFGTITKNEAGEKMADLADMAPYVIGFSDDGRGVQSEEMMKNAMKKCKELGKIISAHCEDNALLFGGYIHDGEYARTHGHRGICSESEWGPIKRDIELVKETGCAYHVCHISTKESVELIRQAKKDGVNITCETGPHYLVMNDSMLKEEGRFKMNPPIRSKEDQKALVEGLIDGTIDVIATDHAPHTLEEKSKGLEKSLMGVTGIETAFPVAYTCLVKENVISLEKLMDVLHNNASRRFGIGNDIAEGEKANLCVFNLDEKIKVDDEFFLSMGKSSPFAGNEYYGKCKMTICDGNIVYQE